MAYPRFEDILEDVMTMTHQVPGTGVQTYSEPSFKLAINRAFNTLWNRQRWDHLWTWETKTLDGTTGKFTTAITGLRYPEDIGECLVGGTSSTINFPSRSEHLSATVGGASPGWRTILPWDDADAETKWLKFWPITATGTVDLLVGHRPDLFEDDDDIIPFDREVITDFAVWWLLEDDGSNPAGIDKARLMSEMSYKDFTARHGAKAIGYGAGRTNGRTVTISP